MTTDTRLALEEEALRRQEGSHMLPQQGIETGGTGTESITYAPATIDPQWLDAYKMFVDRDGQEYGVRVRLPRGQWDAGGANALKNLRRPDGGFWFTLVKPARVWGEGELAAKYECFVGECRKPLFKRSQIPEHVETFHFAEAATYKPVLDKIRDQVAKEDPRLQHLLAELENEEPDVIGADDGAVAVAMCDQCGANSPAEHENPEAWLRGHKLGAHKDGA